MRELISSMMRLSGAVTMFGVEQAQNAVMAPADTQAALVRLRQTLDGMSSYLASKLDEPKKAAFESMSKSQVEMLDRTMGSIDLEAAGEFMRTTSQSLSDVVSRPARARSAGASGGA
jgi:hypothetical protein